MKRRDFLKTTTAISGGGALAGLAGAAGQSSSSTESAVPGPKPNILFIVVDELRYPTVFPGDITTPGEFLAKHMPNVHRNLWTKGVKFGAYHTAANACTPSRGVMISGLYSQQNWLLTTILSTPYPTPTTKPQPVLNPAYPTFGKLLRSSGYRTPYVGKWHVSIPPNTANALDNYGFHFYKSYYDPTGDNFQGTYGDENRGYHSDAYSADNAIDWLTTKRPQDQPWCLTVSLVNPHDREFFPAGTEYKTYMGMFTDPKTNPTDLDPIAVYTDYKDRKYTGPVVPWEKNQLKSPNSYGYPAVPPNWENADSIKAKGIKSQAFFRELQQAVWGGVSDDPSQTTASLEQYPNPNPLEDINTGVVKMPYSYWQRGLDSYTQIMEIVDAQIGKVLDFFHTLPQDVVENTVIVFVSDHGEYSGAHGFVQGKLGSVYKEVWHIPLIVVDPSGRFTDDIDTIRTGLTSSVDLSTLLVSLGNRGTRDWMTGDLAAIYGDRHDMISMLKSADAPGREYVLFATDEVIPQFYNFNKAPTHILGMQTESTKLGVYAKWLPLTSHIIRPSIELEFYDYSTKGGRLELDNTASSDQRAKEMAAELLNNIVPNQMQAALPGSLRTAQQESKIFHLAYRELVALQPSGDWKSGGLQNLLGYGNNF